VLKKFPLYIWISMIIIVICQCSTYYITQMLNTNRTFYDLTIHAIDDKVPFISFFIVFYVLAYPFWILTPFILVKLPKKDYFNWLISGIILYVLFFVIYLIIPTTITRPHVENNNIFDWLTNFIYLMDSPQRPTSLFPSFHCELSIMCYLGVAFNKLFPKWYRIFSFVFMILICLSTQFIKQHYIVDLLGAIVLTLIVYFTVRKLDLSRLIIKKEKRVNDN